MPNKRRSRPSSGFPRAISAQRLNRSSAPKPRRRTNTETAMPFGNYRVEIIPDTEFCLDGGAMFGVVQRTLWSTVFPPDEQNGSG